MTRIRFDRDFDGGSWPGPLDGRDAAAGEAWLGERGVVDQLELMLGLSGPRPTSGERAAALVPGLRANEGSWTRSTKVDPLGSAREILRWRDELVLAGWRGQPQSLPERVSALTRLTGSILPGLPDRVWAITDALEHRSADVQRLELLEPLECLPTAWRSLVEVLRRQGTSVAHIVVEAAPAAGDLASARSKGFRPQNDGSLQLVRSDGPWAAAVEVAAWLASRASTDRAVVVSPTPLLDAELRRFGLPTTGARQVGGGSTILEILPLVLALGWKPAAPKDAAALLSLPESPVPTGLRNRLRRALSQWPAVGSPDWQQALEYGLAAIENVGRRERVGRRLRRIFEAPVDRAGPGYPVSEIRARISLVRDWLRTRRATLDGAPDSDLRRALDEGLEQCRAFERIVDLASLDPWSTADIQRFLDDARSSLASERVLAAEAGLHAVAHPAAITGPARCVVWWDFSRSRAPAPLRIPFTAAERAQLAEAGVRLPSPITQAARNAERWRRPLEQATEALLLVSPRVNESGEENHPHPLWDEIAARIDPQAASRRAAFLGGTLYAAPRATLVEQPLRPPPTPIRTWRVPPDLLDLPDRSSHSAIEDLLRCPMRWTLGRLSQLVGPDEIQVEISNLVLGRLGHALLEAVLPAARNDPRAARELAERWFDEDAPTLVAALFLPGNEAEAARTRRTLADAAETFTEFVRDADLELRFVEKTLEGAGLGHTIFGVPDLVLGPNPVLVDAKWGGFGYRRDALRNGTATQLSFYAHLLSQQPGFDGHTVAVAFFVLSRRRIITTHPEMGSRAEVIEGPSPSDTWVALERAFDGRKEELARGIVLATANPDEHDAGIFSDDSVGPDGALRLAPKCQWCEYGGLCGATLAGGLL